MKLVIKTYLKVLKSSGIKIRDVYAYPTADTIITIDTEGGHIYLDVQEQLTPKVIRDVKRYLGLIPTTTKDKLAKYFK